MENHRIAKGPWTHRMLIVVLSVLLGLLIYWLLGFVLSDIGNSPEPSYSELEQQMLNSEWLQQQKGLESEIAKAEQRIKVEQVRQEILRDSTQSSQQTMNQLLEIQRLSLQQGVNLSQEQQKANSSFSAINANTNV